MNDSDIDTLQVHLDRLGEWAVENEMKINPGKSKAVSFRTARVEDPINYFWGEHRIPEAISYKYLGPVACNSRQGQVVETCESRSEPSGFIKCGECD
jgi:hypothetical protein